MSLIGESCHRTRNARAVRAAPCMRTVTSMVPLGACSGTSTSMRSSLADTIRTRLEAEEGLADDRLERLERLLDRYGVTESTEIVLPSDPRRAAALIDRALPRLTSRDPAHFWTSGQWMTERTGGSDVGLTQTAGRGGDEAIASGIATPLEVATQPHRGAAAGIPALEDRGFVGIQ